MDERNLENSRIQEFLSSQPFIRSCDVMETYQQLLIDHKDNPTMLELVKRRLHEIFDVKIEDNQGRDDYGRKLAGEFEAMQKQIYAWCESGEFTKEKMAGLYASSSIADKFLERWNPKADTLSMDGHVIVNEAFEYVNAGQEDVGLNIFPTPVKGTAELLSKVLEGLQKVANELKNGSLQHVNKVVMTSWLFGPRFEPKVKQIFGDNITLEDVPDENAFEVQRLALSYNKRAMAEYLTTGQLPQVRNLTMTKEEFVSKFAI